MPRLIRWRSPEPPRAREDLRNTIYVDPLMVQLGDDEPPEHYATRLSTVMLVRRDGQVLFVERDVCATDEVTLFDDNSHSDRVFRFQLSPG